MTQHDTPAGPGERWNVDVRAVVAVVAVLAVAVGVLLVARAGGDESPGEASAAPTTTLAPSDGGTSTSGDGPALTTTPAPMPDPTPTTVGPTTMPSSSTTPVATTVAVTTAPGAGPDAVPGDLAIPGRPMQRPGCDGAYVTIVASLVGDQATAESVGALLDTYPRSDYLRTDQTCSSLRADVDGEPIYVVYFGPFAFASDACIARADGPDGAYVKQLSNEVAPDAVVPCT